MANFGGEFETQQIQVGGWPITFIDSKTISDLSYPRKKTVGEKVSTQGQVHPRHLFLLGSSSPRQDSQFVDENLLEMFGVLAKQKTSQIEILQFRIIIYTIKEFAAKKKRKRKTRTSSSCPSPAILKISVQRRSTPEGETAYFVLIHTCVGRKCELDFMRMSPKRKSPSLLMLEVFVSVQKGSGTQAKKNALEKQKGKKLARKI